MQQLPPQHSLSQVHFPVFSFFFSFSPPPPPRFSFSLFLLLLVCAFFFSFFFFFKKNIYSQLEELHYSHETQVGVVFHLLGCLSQFGKLGCVCIGRTREQAEQLYDETIRALDSMAVQPLMTADNLASMLVASASAGVDL